MRRSSTHSLSTVHHLEPLLHVPPKPSSSAKSSAVRPHHWSRRPMHLHRPRAWSLPHIPVELDTFARPLEKRFGCDRMFFGESKGKGDYDVEKNARQREFKVYSRLERRKSRFFWTCRHRVGRTRLLQCLYANSWIYSSSPSQSCKQCWIER